MNPGEPAHTSPSQPIRFSDREIQRRLQFVGFAVDDLARVKALANLVDRHAQEFVEAFFGQLAVFPETSALTGNPALMERARHLKGEHLRAMVGGTYDTAYVQERLTLGGLYASAGVEPAIFLGAFHIMLTVIGRRALEHFGTDSHAGFAHLTSLRKVGFFDLSLIVDVLIFERERTIRAQRERIIHLQQEAIRELSTPVLPLRPRLLLVPLIGVIDSQRARQLIDALLTAVRTHRAKVVVLDLTAVPIIDSAIAQRLMKAVTAARLMGAATILTGVSTQVAHAMTRLEVQLEGVQVVGDLQRGLVEAERVLGFTRQDLA
jgi:rsbT co-antagonist protein RsbR